MGTIYAIIETGGKQYQVSPGQSIDVELLNLGEGASVELDRVLLIADGSKVTVGTPLVAGARVLAKSLGDGKARKIVVFKFKAKERYSKKTGHRQPYTRLSIEQILGPGESAPAVKKPRRRTKKEVTTDGA